MYRITSFLLLLLSFSMLKAQAPEGKLYTICIPVGGVGLEPLGYVEYPSGNYVHVDSVANTFGMMSHNGLLYLDQFNRIAYYDAATAQFLDTIQIYGVQNMAGWGDKLLVQHRNPYGLKVLDISNGYTTVFSLDSTKIHYTTDIVVVGDRAFLIRSSDIQVIDLVAQDTLGSIPTHHPLPQGINQVGRFHEGMVYFDVDYATGAYRHSLMTINPWNLIVDTAYHKEFMFNPPYLVGSPGQVHVMHFDSHYDIVGDSLYEAPMPAVTHHSVAYDAFSDSHILFYPTLVPSDIAWWHNGQYSSPTALPHKLLFSEWVSDNANAVEPAHEGNSWLKVYPNPASDEVRIEIDGKAVWKEIALYDLAGKLVRMERPGRYTNEWKLDLDGIASGSYVLRVETNTASLSRKLMVD